MNRKVSSESIINKRHSKSSGDTTFFLRLHFFTYATHNHIILFQKETVYNSTERYEATMNPHSKAAVDFYEENDATFGNPPEILAERRGLSPTRRGSLGIRPQRRAETDPAGVLWNL